MADPGTVTRRLTTGAAWVSLGTLASQGFVWVVSIFLARMLGPIAYGSFAIVVSTILAVGAVTGPVTGLFAARYLGAYRHHNPQASGRIATVAICVAALLGAVLAGLLFLGAQHLAGGVLKVPGLTDELRLAAPIIFLSAIEAAQTGILIGLESFRALAVVALGRGAIHLAVMWGGVVVLGLRGAVLGLGLSALAGVLLSALFLGRAMDHVGLLFARIRLADWKLASGFSVPTFLNALMVLPISWIANVGLVRGTHGTAELGIFNVANQWRTLLMFLPMVLNQPLLPIMAQTYHERAWLRFRRLFFSNTMAVLVLTGGAATLVLGAWPWIVRVYGSAYSVSTAVLPLLLLTAVLASGASVGGTAISSMARMWEALALNTAWALVFLGFFFLRSSRTAMGLAQSYALSYGLHLLTVLWYLLRRMRRESESSVSAPR